ncbi:hypothetical protein [Streptomyces sp. NPDC046985]|uniref:hypothetical protein n=1 Tax=Streptomyces sp. NPDC046985 TaxID=3155377 RepID=UPI0033E2AA65
MAPAAERPPEPVAGGRCSELEDVRKHDAAPRPDRSGRAAHHRLRSFVSALLVVLGCVLAPFGAVAAWSAAVVDDTDRYVATVAPLAADPAVQAAAADRVTDALMGHIHLADLLQGAAPQDRPRLAKALGGLAVPLQDAVREFVRVRAQEVIASGAFQRIWVDANREVHAAVDEALTGEGAVAVHDGAVTVDLAPVIDQVKQRLVDHGLTIAAHLPPIHTDFTVLRSDALGKLRVGLWLLRIAGLWLPVLAALLLAAGVLSAAHRRRVLVAGVLGAAVAMLVLGVGLTVVRELYLGALPSGVSRPAAGAVYDTLIRYLRISIREVVALAAVIAAAAWLSGRGRRATFARQAWRSGIRAVRTAADGAGLRTGPVGPYVHRHRTWITWLLVAAAAVTYLLWSYPTGWVVLVLALALLCALAVAEFLDEPGPPGTRGPDTGAGVPGG